MRVKIDCCIRLALAIIACLSISACIPALQQLFSTPTSTPTPPPTPTATPKPAELFSGVCQGAAAPQAAEYTFDHAPHPAFASGDFSLTLPKDWQAQSVSGTELVFCMLEEEHLLQTCDYSGATMKRYNYVVSTRVLEAKSAREIANFTVRGVEPGSCPIVVVIMGNESREKISYGPHISESDVLPYLEPYVLTSHILYQPDENFYFPTSMTFSPDGKYFAAGMEDTFLWDLDSGQLLQALKLDREGKTDLINDIAISQDLSLIASGSTGPQVSIWETGSGQLLHTVSVNEEGALKLAISPDNSTLAVGGMDGKITLWDISSGNNQDSLDAWFIMYLAFSSDGKYLVVGDSSGLGFWDLESGQQEATRLELEDFPNYLFFAMRPDGRTLVAGSCSVYGDYPSCASGMIHIWDLESRQVIQELPLPLIPVDKITLSPDGSLLAAISCIKEEGVECPVSQVEVWEVETNQSLVKFQAAGEFHKLAFSTDGRLLAAGLSGGNILFYDIPAGEGQ